MFKLVIQDDEGKTTVVPLIRDEITIGRKEGNTIRLTERNVSRRHARILRSDNEVQIEDLGSYNGIRVNNARIAERVSLRISDQVQIGDYKLYLKAEGVEQVDDARTMPIERIDTPPAEMPAVAAPPSSIPTTPMPAQARPAAVAQMAVADTDPAGRPVATAAQVAALTAPASYGKLVIISSNYPGKELDLTRPQMIIGRTDENDLVINHRSISRNHAKVTRDTETQRYTISDLQSSNGVRVNGQDYGKVELRRGDVVDLGHVRMRFVEPGEDFVFNQSMIADITETGGKRGLLVAIILGVVVLGAAGAYFALKPSPANNGSNTHGTSESNGGGSDTHGSAGSAIAVAMADIDAGVGQTMIAGSSDNPEIKRLQGDCYADVTGRQWSDLVTCADQLDGIQPGAGKDLRAKAKLEIGAERDFTAMQGSLKDRNLRDAQKSYDKIPGNSVYIDDAKKVMADKKQALINEGIKTAKSKSHRCEDLEKFIAQQNGQYGDEISAAISAAVKCEAPVVVVAVPLDCSTTLQNAKDAKCKQQFCAGHEDAPQCAPAVAPPPAQNCQQLVDAGTAANAQSDYVNALKDYEKAYSCKPDGHVLSLTFMSACNAGKVDRARYWWKKLSSDEQTHDVIICVRAHIGRDQLDASP
ncbi:MAG TPA: FHA domain-containing protein [Kofleriaceae bacterium]|jgi:pSer/pThr/pTyr-binding forkhead associated (FHA) protein|nr:FHA domain-containing protein [Kofleriaceae bacterium]